MKIIKKAAMFGLDARIALAIFGALSVISGAALYSAIQQAKVVQWQTYFNELTKASEAYYLDTGIELSLTSDSAYSDRERVAIRDLALNDDDIVGWKGPYWQTTSYSATTDNFFKDSTLTTISNSAFIRLYLRETSDWDTSINTSPDSNELCIENSVDCAEWFAVSVSGAFNNEYHEKILKIYNILDEKIDNGDGVYKGNIRYSTNVSGYLFVKGRNRVYKG